MGTKMFLYQLYDRLALSAAPVFEAVNDLVAERVVVRSAKIEGYPMEDLTLYRVGSRDLDVVGVVPEPEAVVVSMNLVGEV